MNKILIQLVLATGLVTPARADPILTEFMAANDKALADNDGDFSDWVEIHNPDATAVDLAGWYLTDNAGNKTKWQFPSVTIPAGGYLVVFASDKNRRDPAQPLHTNFSLNADGEYLALVKPGGLLVASEFAPQYPSQYDDVSYGLTQPTAAGEAARAGFFRTPTPNARNGGAESLLLLERVTLSQSSGPFVGTITLTMTGATAGQRIRYVAVPPSTTGAAVAEPTATSTAYEGPITVSSTVIIRAAVFSSDNVQHGYPTTGHYVRVATTGEARLDTFASQLPLLVIDTHGTGTFEKDGIERPAWLYAWTRPTAGSTSLLGPPATVSSLTTNVRGASSAGFPKKSLTLKLNDTLGHDRAVPLLGLNSFDTWTLVGPWTFDVTYLHNVFIYALSNQIGRWAPRTQLVEVFGNFNGGDLDATDYNGIYILTDTLQVDPQRVAITAIEPTDTSESKITGGYLLKLDLPDSDEFSFQTKNGFPEQPFILVVSSPKAAKLPQVQRNYIKGYIDSFEDALNLDRAGNFQQRTHLNYIDRPSWIDHHILGVLSSSVDGLYRSTYMTKDRGGRLVAGPAWDYDRAMDGGDGRTTDPTLWNGPAGAVDFWNFGWWGSLGRDPEFMQAWIDRWQNLRQNEFLTANLTGLVDEIAAQIGPAAAARDAARWPENNSTRYGGWQGEVDNLKDWLYRRAGWIDGQFHPAPVITRNNNTLTVTPGGGIRFAYTTDGTDPRAIGGGGVSTNAQLSTTPLVLPATTNLRVRTYRANLPPNTYPGTAWSSSVAGGTSITTQPANQAAAAGGSVTFTTVAPGNPTYQWQFNGSALAGEISSSLAVKSIQPAKAGLYVARVTGGGATFSSQAGILGLSSTAKLVGPGTEFPNIFHSGTGFTYDQILLEGTAASVTADPTQILRISYIDLNNDIVQVEFSGAGTLSLVLEGASGPAGPQNYNQAVNYMKGHAGIVLTGANATTNLSVFSVGRANAANQALFRDDVTYDGVADIAFVAITSTDGKFGGLRTANASYFGTKGLTGVYAPGVEFTGPVFVGDIRASGVATPILAIGSGTDVRITGGDLLQDNGRAVQVSGVSQLQFVNGSSSHGTLFPAQNNRARLEQNGTDVTAQIVIKP